ncbi:LPXTG cell wall anchor domain-containing protein [Muricoccus radiodurans]
MTRNDWLSLIGLLPALAVGLGVALLARRG